ncbi:MAG: cysteine desulfurase family protein [bacterium]|nr:cysteine desulfurase family protein [bacterium]
MNVYLDNASSTRLDERVVEAIMKTFYEDIALPLSEFVHTPGQRVKELIEESRKKIASFVGAESSEIIFTSGGTEANNLAIKGIAYARAKKGKHVVTTAVEGRSVLDSVRRLEKSGFRVDIVPVDRYGFVDLDALERAVSGDTILVSVQMVNDEVGTIQPLEEVVKIVKSKNPETFIHTDATYGIGWIPFNVKELRVDLASFTAHKIHGPKGIGALYVKKGVSIEKQMDGGYAEFNLRGGTPNIHGIVGFAKAVEILSWDEVEKVRNLRDYLYKRIISSIPEVVLIGPSDFSRRHPANLNLSFKYVEGESVVLYMDMKGVAVISGSACFSRGLEPSYVIMAMGHSHEDAHGSIRFSLSKYNTKEEMDYTVLVLEEVIKSLRELSPLGGN